MTNPIPAARPKPPEATAAQANLDDQVAEDARVAFVAAVDLWIYEGTLIWSKFNAMLVANSVVLATIGLTATGSPGPKGESKLFTAALAAAGLVLCALWMALNRRGYEYHRYWVLSARELEEQHLAPTSCTVSRGGTYADGDPVSMMINNRSNELRMSRMSRWLRTGWNSYLIVATFALLYLLFMLRIWW